ncbi:unnamed protein product [Cyclocybe aegerita]|uniref:Uncharacterized protein n=1 Tax=Cyclocybe aegerita TaxID=1973307 RepID=A0A8S0WPL3_CYCAE|nr:unnamed protein product [Cyclocybe aegerita]
MRHRSHAHVNFGPLACALQPPLVTSPSAGSSHHLVPPGAIQQRRCCTNHHPLALLTLCRRVSPIQHPQGSSNDAPGARTTPNCDVWGHLRAFSLPPAWFTPPHPLALLALRCPFLPIQQPRGHPMTPLSSGSFACVLMPLPTWFTPPPPPRPPPPLLAIQHPQGPSNDTPGAQTSSNFRVWACLGLSFAAACLVRPTTTLLALLALCGCLSPSNTPRGRPTTPLVHQ